MRSSGLLLPLLFALLWVQGCSGCSDHAATPELEKDAGSSPMADASVPFVPEGVRPELSDSAAMVPLLYGRFVELEEQRDGRAGVRIVPLDDPEHAAYRAFFGDLERMCLAEVGQTLAPAMEGLKIPGCARDGVFSGLMFACRARAALLFTERGSAHGIAQRAGEPPRLSPGSPDDQRLWTAANDALSVRASFAMLATDQLRHAVAAFAKTLDLETCSSFKKDEGFASAPIDELAAEGLERAVLELRRATKLADSLLTADMVDRVEAFKAMPDANTALTRALNYSLLERQKLYAGIPYGAFTPLAGEGDSASEPVERYPAASSRVTEREHRVAYLLRELSVLPLASDAFVAASDDVLTTRVFDGLRHALPRTFGAWDAARASEALAQLSLRPEDLVGGARFLTQELKVHGAPVITQRSLDQIADLGPATYALDAFGPLGYELAITEGMAVLASDESEFALRGLAHAEQVAAHVALQTDESRALSPSARALLQRLADDLSLEPAAELCASPRADGGTDTRLTLRGARISSAATDRFELWRGEVGAACALSGSVSGAPCSEAEHSAGAASFDSEQAALVFAPVSGKGRPTHRVYLSERGRNPESVQGRVILGAFSVEPLRVPKREGCGRLPLGEDLLDDMRRVHVEDLDGALVRSQEITPPKDAFPLALREDDVVPLHWARTVRIVDPEGETVDVDLSNPLRPVFSAFIEAVAARCIEPSAPDLSGPRECSRSGFAEASRRTCIARELRELSSARADVRLGALRLMTPTRAEQTSLRLFALAEAEVALTELLDLVDPSRCAPKDEEETRLRNQLIGPLATALVSHLDDEELSLREALLIERDESSEGENDPDAKEVARLRGLSASSLAAARLYVATPRSLYGPRAETTEEALADADRRFPVVTRRARVEEDTRIESLLRSHALDPRASDLTLVDGEYDAGRVSARLFDGTLSLRLRERMIALDPSDDSLPTDARELLRRLGVNQTQLESAVLRIIEQSEARGLSVLARRATSPLEALGLKATQPGPEGAHLYALTDGRVGVSESAAFHHASLRGLFHLWSRAVDVLRATDTLAGLSSDEQSKRRALIQKLETRVTGDTVVVELVQTAEGPRVSLELSLPAGLSPRDLRSHVELWWTDSGLRCALSGNLSGEACDPSDFRFGMNGLSIGRLAPPSSGRAQRVRMSNFVLPEPASWDPALTNQKARGRVYVTYRENGKRRVMASASLEAAKSNTARVTVADSDALRSVLVSLLSYRTPGEGCATCTRRSVCERASCELGVCIRTNTPDNTPCTATGVCVAGVCDKPGCGDGARSTGEDGVPFEACDDGNLFSDDGCSAMCVPEVRRLEPTLPEGYPAGPAPAVGVDGLGRALIVYMTDALVGEDVAIRTAPLDAFGAPSGPEQTLESAMPRGYFSRPTVAGLRDGGFVVAYASPSVLGRPGIAYRFVDAFGAASEAKAADASAALASEPRVLALGEGFVIAWVEGAKANYGSRIRMRRFDALGEPLGAAVDVAPSLLAVDQKSPVLAGSLGQVLVVWSEADPTLGTSRGLYGRRFDVFGDAAEAGSFAIAEGQVNEPAVAVLGTSDYLVAYSDQRSDPLGDLSARTVRRFGPALEGSVERAIARTAEAETRPVVAGARDASFVVGHQLGSPQAHAVLIAPSIDPTSVDTLNAELAYARLRDLSIVGDQRGIWVVWSELLSQSRALFVYRLPLDKAP